MVVWRFWKKSFVFILRKEDNIKTSARVQQWWRWRIWFFDSSPGGSRSCGEGTADVPTGHLYVQRLFDCLEFHVQLAGLSRCQKPVGICLSDQLLQLFNRLFRLSLCTPINSGPIGVERRDKCGKKGQTRLLDAFPQFPRTFPLGETL